MTGKEDARREAREALKPQDIEELYRMEETDCASIATMIEDDPGGVLILDTETTGLSPEDDDILELSIINGSGRIVYSKRFGSWLEEWPEAQRVHGISPEDVKGLPTIETEAAKITGLLRRARAIAGYNVYFDTFFLARSGVRIPKVPHCDVMEDFAQVYGQWEDWINDGLGGWKWQKLTKAGKHYGISTEGAHGSLRDCEITLGVLKRIAKEPERVRFREPPS